MIQLGQDYSCFILHGGISSCFDRSLLSVSCASITEESNPDRRAQTRMVHPTVDFHRLLLKAGCRWDENCTIGVENLVFEVILVAFSSIFRQET